MLTAGRPAGAWTLAAWTTAAVGGGVATATAGATGGGATSVGCGAGAVGGAEAVVGSALGADVWTAIRWLARGDVESQSCADRMTAASRISAATPPTTEVNRRVVLIMASGSVSRELPRLTPERSAALDASLAVAMRPKR